MKKTSLFTIFFLFSTGFFLTSGIAFAKGVSVYKISLPSVPKLVYSQSGDIQIANPETAQEFYDELKGKPRDYFINSDKSFE